MITQEQITSVLQHLPNQFSIGELIDMLVLVDKANNKAASYDSALPRRETEHSTNKIHVSINSPTKPQLSSAVAALRGIAKLGPEDADKSYDELRWEAMRTKYEL